MSATPNTENPKNTASTLPVDSSKTKPEVRQNQAAETSGETGSHYKPPYMRWFEGDFWADGDVRRMTWLQRHFYRALLLAAFQCETRPYLPDDDAQLWRLAGANRIKDWRRNRRAVVAKFTAFTDGSGRRLLSNPRLVDEWKHATTKHEQAREGGKARWKRQPSAGGELEQTEKSGNSREISGTPGNGVESPFPKNGVTSFAVNESVERELSGSSANQNQNQNQNQKAVLSLEKKEPKKVFVPPEWIPAEEWQAYLEMRKRIKRPMTAKAVELAVKKLAELREIGDDPKEVLERSILNSWQGLFPLQNQSRKAGTNHGYIKGDPNINRAAAAEALRRIEAREGRVSEAANRPSGSDRRNP
jgi:hypothetical protein